MTLPISIEDPRAQFLAELDREDDLGMIIRAHIRIEILLNGIVETLAPNPKYIGKLELDYHHTVVLAMLLGLKAGIERPLRALGKLRNDFAHDIDTTMDLSKAKNLYETLEAEDKNIVQEVFKRVKDKHPDTITESSFNELQPRDKFKLIAVVLWERVNDALSNTKNSE
jgi:HAMP domain-containing protein